MLILLPLLLFFVPALGRIDVQSILSEHHDQLQEKNQVVHGSVETPSSLIKIYEDQLTISPRQKRTITEAAVGIIESQADVLDKTTMHELELVTGQVGSRENALAEYIDRTKTDAGKYAFRSYLLQPINDREILEARQHALREIVSNQELFVRLKAIVSRVASVENILAANVTEDVIANSFDKTLPHWPWYIPFSKQFNSLSRSSTFLANINRIGWVLDSYLEANPLSYLMTATMSGCLWTIPQFFGYNYLLQTSGVTGINYFSFIQSVAFDRNFREMRSAAIDFGVSSSLYMSSYKYPYFAYQIYKTPDMPEMANYAALAVGGAWAGWRCYTSYNNISLDATRMKLMQHKISAVARLVQSLDEISELIQSNYVLKKALKCEGLLAEVLDSQLPEYQSLLNKLRSNTFAGKPSYWSNQGKISTAFSQFKKYNQRLYKGLRVIAELDLLQAAADLLIKSSDEHPWCLPTYDFESLAPKLEVNGVWHPYLIKNKAVLNDVKFGVDNTPQTMVVTGPNAGGKSTIMKSVGIAALLAQTKLGVAPARSMLITPFDTIITYLNITDRLSEGESLFKASVKRAHEVVLDVQRLSDSQKGLVILDEVFTGTASKEGSAAAYALVKKLGNMSHVITVAVTHFPIITKLEMERPELFANWKVTVSKHSDGKLEYPFMLERGIADQNIAFDIMKKEGYASDFMEEAENALLLMN